ncbi:MAG TPA: TetR/AcrR family transcriptional regulator [Mycobacteriales bacterium]|nr:TetR/AcrR family transcriptional regulator [Mycobacteriales bacterium]
MAVDASQLAAPGADSARLAAVTEQASHGFEAWAGQTLLPPRVYVEGTLRRLYETALILFGQRGFHAVSVRDLTKELGLQASSLYAHVPSKQDLLADLLRIGHEEHRDALRLSLLEAGTDPADQIAILTRAHVRVHATYPLLTKLCNRELSALPDGRRDEIVAIRTDAGRMFYDVIERGQRLGVFAPLDPMLTAAAIGAMGIRVAEWWHPQLEVDIETVAETYAAFAVRMVS